MKVVDARSGEVMSVGSTVRYPDGEWIRLDAVYPGLLQTKAMVSTARRDFQTGKLVVDTHVNPLTVRYLHPAFLFQKVGFIES